MVTFIKKYYSLFTIVRKIYFFQSNTAKLMHKLAESWKYKNDFKKSLK